jgi:hypothetical protein
MNNNNLINDSAGMVQGYQPKPGDRPSRVDRGDFNRHGLVKSQMGPPLLFFPEPMKRLFDPRDVQPYLHPEVRIARDIILKKMKESSDNVDSAMSTETTTTIIEGVPDADVPDAVPVSSLVTEESQTVPISSLVTETENSDILMDKSSSLIDNTTNNMNHSITQISQAHSISSSQEMILSHSRLTGISEVYVMARFDALQNNKSLSESPSSSSSTTSILPVQNNTICFQTNAQKRLKRKLDNEAANIARVEKERAIYDPKNNKSVTGNAYCTLYIGRLNYKTTEETLRNFFSPFGEIVSIKIIRKRTLKEGDDEEGAALTVLGPSRGYGFIEFATESGVRAAFQNSKGVIIDERKIITDVERGRTVRGWFPARLGGGLSKSRPTIPKKPTPADDRVYPPIGAFGVLIPISLEGQTSPMAVMERHSKIKAAAKRLALDNIAKATGTWVPQQISQQPMQQSTWPVSSGSSGGGGGGGGRPGSRWARQNDQFQSGDFNQRSNEGGGGSRGGGSFSHYERDRSRDDERFKGGRY